jgi:hypothetical protein
MNTLTSIAAHGLLPVPLMSNTPHSRILGSRIASGGSAKAAPLTWLPQDATQRLELQDELAPMRRELRVAMLLRAAASLPRPSQVAEALKRQAERMPLWYLWLLAIFAPPMVIGSASWMVAGVSLAKHLLGLGGTALYGTIMMQAIYGLGHRLR